MKNERQYKSQDFTEGYKRIYDKNPKNQEVTDASMIELWAEEGISPEQVIFYFAFSVLLG